MTEHGRETPTVIRRPSRHDLLMQLTGSRLNRLRSKQRVVENRPLGQDTDTARPRLASPTSPIRTPPHDKRDTTSDTPSAAGRLCTEGSREGSSQGARSCSGVTRARGSFARPGSLAGVLVLRPGLLAVDDPPVGWGRIGRSWVGSAEVGVRPGRTVVVCHEEPAGLALPHGGSLLGGGEAELAPTFALVVAVHGPPGGPGVDGAHEHAGRVAVGPGDQPTGGGGGGD